MRKLLLLIGMSILVLAACSNKENANEFPDKDIKLIVPFAPGGAVDTISRIIAKNGDSHLDKNKIIVENKEGGGAVIGQSFVAGANPDGYTLLAFTSSVVSNPLTTETNYTHEDFEPIIMYSFEPELLVVPNNSSIQTFKDFEDKATGQGISLATPGHSTSHHTAGILLKENHNWKLNFVHTESGGEQLQQLLGGHVESALMTYGEVQAQIKEGTIRAIGIMDTERSEMLPEVTTFKEENIDIVYGPFRGIAAPKGISKENKDKLEDIFTRILKDEKFINDMSDSGYQVIFGSSKDLEEKVKNEYEFINQALPFILEK